LTLLPVGVKGLLIASLFAAYRSTMETHLNWGASYLVIDFYQRFLKPGRSERHYLWVSRSLTALLMVACGFFTLALSTASEAFQLLLSVGAGTGLIYLLRWFWWRINAWSEISAMVSSFAVALGFFVAKKAGVVIQEPWPLLITVGLTTIVWVTVTLLTAPADRATLVRFYERTRPAGPGWNAIRAETNLPPSSDSLPQMLLGWTAGVTFVYAGLFGTGSLIYGHTTQATVWIVVFVVSGLVLVRVVQRLFSGECTKAVILARGLGTRMRAPDGAAALAPDQARAADTGVKAMIPVGRPFLDYVLSGLADAGFREVCIVVAPDDATIRDHYTKHAPSRIRVAFAVQQEAKGTADAVLPVEDYAGGEPFVVLNGDNYYPTDVLRRLRLADGCAGVAFTREGLLRTGDVPADRIAKYAILDVAQDGKLERIVEKPVTSKPGDRVSMNCWRLTSDMFRACREVPVSKRGEYELPAAVLYAIQQLGMSFQMVSADATVLDLSHRADVPTVAARLQAVKVEL
jgi:dTDP-glucose pyrophosphorylase